MATSSEDPKEGWDVEKAIKNVIEECALCGYYPNPDKLKGLDAFAEIQFRAVFQWLEKLKTCAPTERTKKFDHALRMGRFAGKSM